MALSGAISTAFGDVPTNGEGWGHARPGFLAQALIEVSRRTPFGRGKMRGKMARAIRSLHPGPVDTHLWGVPVRLHPWRNACERKALLRPDRLDPLERSTIRSAVASAPSVFIDIGANVGLYSLYAAEHAAPGSVIVAVEPNAALASRFRYNLQLAKANGAVGPEVTVKMRMAAVSDHAGTGFLEVGNSEGGGHLSDAGTDERVEIVTLAHLVEALGVDRVDAIKIDVEGHEDRILPPFLASAGESLWPGLVVIEHLSRKEWSVDCIADCLARGYRIEATTRNNTVLRRSAHAGTQANDDNIAPKARG